MRRYLISPKILKLLNMGDAPKRRAGFTLPKK